MYNLYNFYVHVYVIRIKMHHYEKRWHIIFSSCHSPRVKKKCTMWISYFDSHDQEFTSSHNVKRSTPPISHHPIMWKGSEYPTHFTSSHNVKRSTPHISHHPIMWKGQYPTNFTGFSQSCCTLFSCVFYVKMEMNFHTSNIIIFTWFLYSLNLLQ